MRAFTIGLLTLASCAGQPYPIERETSVEAVTDRWFSAFTVAEFTIVDLAERPTSEQVARALPKNAKTSLRIWFECSVTSRRAPSDCRPTRAWPDEGRTVQAGRSLLPAFRLTDEANQLVQRYGGKFILDMYLDDEARQLDRSCPPNWCPATPAPPPPPPPALEN
jgi:hypothetical protein